jgi:hypothetical protein
MERASFGLREVKLAAGDGGADMVFTGYGAVFGNTDSYGDVIQPGAFADTLAAAQKSGAWPAMLMQHGGIGLGADDMTPVGIWTEMSEDSIGLRVTGKLADTARGREAYALLKMTPRPAIDGLSIGYAVKAYEARTRPDEPRRRLTKLDLFEVSLVTFPANPKARISGVKSFDPRALEAALRSEAGLSNAAAVTAVAIMKKHLREEDGQVVSDGRDAAGLADIGAALRRNIDILTEKRS